MESGIDMSAAVGYVLQTCSTHKGCDEHALRLEGRKAQFVMGYPKPHHVQLDLLMLNPKPSTLNTQAQSLNPKPASAAKESCRGGRSGTERAAGPPQAVRHILATNFLQRFRV